MFTPNGQSAGKMDSVMLLALWAMTLEHEQSKIDNLPSFIFAGMGRPTFPINETTIASFKSYWEEYEKKAKIAKENLNKTNGEAAVPYGNPQGDNEPRKIMAEAMSKWYGVDIEPENIQFTTGGAGALYVTFKALNDLYENTAGYRIITPFPHYTLYADNPFHVLHPINVMREKGYRLTAKALQESIEEAKRKGAIDKKIPKAVLLCNPSNPLGTVINKQELIEIAEVLSQYPELYIILDEAYAEMSYVEMNNLLQLAPHLRSRIVILRSATKGFSAAGERMAAIICFDKILMTKILEKNIGISGHPPRSSQLAYAKTMASFDINQQKELKSFYEEKINLVNAGLKKMGAALPDADFKTEGTFYALADLSDLFGMDLPDGIERALGRKGKIANDEDIAYYLMFKHCLMIAPLSYYGLAKERGFLRITCSSNEAELNELLNRLEQCLISARKKIKNELIEKINHAIDKNIQQLDNKEHLKRKLQNIISQKETCSSLKEQNRMLRELLLETRLTPKEFLDKAIKKLQSLYKKHLLQKNKTENEERIAWYKFLDNLIPEPCSTKNALYNIPQKERIKFKGFLENQIKKNTESSDKNLDDFIKIKDPIREGLIEALYKYINRIEDHKNPIDSTKPDFSYGFWHHKNSRAVNREANYYLAKHFLSNLKLTNCTIDSIFYNAEQQREDIILGKNSINEGKSLKNLPDYKKRSINSDELNSIINYAKSL